MLSLSPPHQLQMYAKPDAYCALRDRSRGASDYRDNKEESAFVYTSNAGCSSIQMEEENFVFNSNALVDTDIK